MSFTTKLLRRTTALFDDFAQDDRCLDAACFNAKVDAHVEFQKEKTAGLIQITRAYFTNAKADESGSDWISETRLVTSAPA